MSHNAALRAWLPRGIVLGMVSGLYALSQYPSVSASERAALASRFRFTRTPLPGAGGPAPARTGRAVHPQLKHMAGWMSSMGASVALADLDGDGLPNDVCHIDTRGDRVIVAPAPGTAARYAPLVLDPAPLPYRSAATTPLVYLPADLNEDDHTNLLVTY